MGAAALDPAPSAGVCRDGSDLALQSFGRAIDVAMICRSIRIHGKALGIRQRFPDFLGRFPPFRYVPAEFRRSSSPASRRSEEVAQRSGEFRGGSAPFCESSAPWLHAVSAGEEDLQLLLQSFSDRPPDPGAVPGTFWKVPRGSSGLPQEFRVVLAELGRSGDQSGDDLRGRPSERLAVPGDRDGGLLPSGGSPSCSRISLQRSVAAPRLSRSDLRPSVAAPRLSGPAPRRSRVALRRSEAVPRRSFRARPRSAVIVCLSAGVPPEGVRRRREAAQLSACSSLLWDLASLKAGAAGAARRSAGLIQSSVSC